MLKQYAKLLVFKTTNFTEKIPDFYYILFSTSQTIE